MKKILIADDDAIFRQILNTSLTQLGYTVVENDSGLGVLERVLQSPPDACIIDIIMDGKEGLETLAELNTLANRPKLIAVSSDSEYLEWAKDFGADTTLHKPVTLQKLQDALAVIFSSE